MVTKWDTLLDSDFTFHHAISSSPWFAICLLHPVKNLVPKDDLHRIHEISRIACSGRRMGCFAQDRTGLQRPHGELDTRSVA